MSERGRRYLAYLLRLWQVEGEEEAAWRASLHNPRSGERRGFANLAELFAFLEGQVGRASRDQPPPAVAEKGGAIEHSSRE